MKKIIVFLIIICVVGVFVYNNSVASENIIKDEVISKNINEVQSVQIIQQEEKEYYYNIPLDKKYQDFIKRECNKYNLSETLVLAIIKTESEFNINAVSNNKQDVGLFQLNSGTWPFIAKELNIHNFNPHNPEHNIKAGVWYLNYLREHFQQKGMRDEDVFVNMIISYNMGIDGAKRFISRGGYNSRYLRSVINSKVELEQ